jgi:hypothetical protein
MNFVVDISTAGVGRQVLPDYCSWLLQCTLNQHLPDSTRPRYLILRFGLTAALSSFYQPVTSLFHFLPGYPFGSFDGVAVK